MQEAAKKKPGKYIFHYNTVLLNIYLKVFNHYACIGTYVEQDLVALLTQILSKTYYVIQLSHELYHQAGVCPQIGFESLGELM